MSFCARLVTRLEDAAIGSPDRDGRTVPKSGVPQGYLARSRTRRIRQSAKLFPEHRGQGVDLWRGHHLGVVARYVENGDRLGDAAPAELGVVR